jgi:hypothetical protein
VVGEQVHHHHAETGAGGDQRDVAIHLDQMEAQVARGALEPRERALRQRAAERKLVGIVAERGAVVANDLRVAGDEPSVGGEGERVDLEEFEILAPGDLRQARGIAREPRRDVTRKQPGKIGIERVGSGIAGRPERNARERLGRLHLLAAFCGEQLEPLAGAVDADREVDFTRDRHCLLEQQQRLRVVEGRGDARACRRELAEVAEPLHQAALAAAAFQHLRLEHVPGPLPRLGGSVLTRADEDAARDGETVAAQQGFPVDLGQAHNAFLSPPRRPAPSARTLACPIPPSSACHSSTPSRGGWS